MSDETEAPPTPEPLPDLTALFIEAQQKAAKEKERQDAEHAQKEAEFFERVDRVVGRHTWKPGDESGVLCPACRQSYVFDAAMRQVHPGDCPGYRVRQIQTVNGAYGERDD